MERTISKVIVIGSGAMGLAAAYHALKAGHEVEVFEAAPEPGGMAAHFDFDGLSIERFYHFVSKTDKDTFELMRDLGMEEKMRWRKTSMGLFTRGRLRNWGNPIALLSFSEISLVSRLRYALFAFVSVQRDRWGAIETESARSWITRWCGEEVYNILWKPLFELKFYQYAGNVSAAWIWTRVRRIGRSRASMMQEELGYIEGGSQTLVDALCTAITNMGGRIHLGSAIKKVLTEHGRVAGVETSAGMTRAEAVICTVPTPLVSAMIPDLPASYKSKYDAIMNMGVCCLVFKLKRSVSPHFWVNVSEPDMAIPGIIEFSNLRPTGNDTIIYVPYYMPNDFPKFGWTDEALLNQAFSYLQRINPALQPGDVTASHVARLRFAQPVCEPGFAAMIPPVMTPIEGLQVADTCFYYPEDRGISESVRFGKEMAARVPLVS